MYCWLINIQINQTKEKQTRRRTFVIEESPTNATGAVDCIIEEGEYHDMSRGICCTVSSLIF